MADVCGDDGAGGHALVGKIQDNCAPSQVVVLTRKGKHVMFILNSFFKDQMMKRKLRNGHARKHLHKAVRKIHARFVKKLERKFSAKDMAIATSRRTFRPRKKGPSAVQRPNTRTLTSIHHSSCATVTKEVPCLSSSYDYVGCCSADRTIEPSFSTYSLRPENERLASSLPGKLVQYPEKPGEPDCRYYMKFGECKHMAFCKYNHPKDMFNFNCKNTTRSDSLCMHDQTAVLENQSALPSAVDKARAHTTNHLASASSSMISEEAGGESRDEVFVCICGEKLQFHTDFNRTTVKELVVSALKRRGIKYCDIYVTLRGKILKGEQILSSIPVYPSTHIHVKPRIRGGMLRSIPMEYARLDHYINRARGLFNRVQLPQNLCKPNMTVTCALFLNDFSRFVIHQLLVCVLRDGHQSDRCWWGAFDLKDILICNGDVRISPDIHQHNYSPEGSKLDYLKLKSILFAVFFNHDLETLPCHMSHLLLLLENSPEALRQDRRFINFLINHPCLLSCAEKVARYVQLDHVIANLGPHDRHMFRNLVKQIGWFPTWIDRIMGIPDLWSTYMYNPITNPDGSLRSRFSCTLDDCSHLARNFLSHFLRMTSLQQAEAAVSLYLEFLLPNIMMILLSHTGPDHWNADLLQIFSNTNSDRSVGRVPEIKDKRQQ